MVHEIARTSLPLDMHCLIKVKVTPTIYSCFPINHNTNCEVLLYLVGTLFISDLEHCWKIKYSMFIINSYTQNGQCEPWVIL